MEKTPSEKTLQASTSSAAPPGPKPRRILACIQCQQRKVKCDRQTPCGNCIKHRAQCVPAVAVYTHPRPRRRRFPELQLLDRIRRYETLLRQNNIAFAALHEDPSVAEKLSRDGDDGGGGDGNEFQGNGQPGAGASSIDRSSWSPSTTGKSEAPYEIKNFWHAINQKVRVSDDASSDSSPDEVNDAVLSKTWSEHYPSHDHLLFGPAKTAVELSTLQPEQVQILRLWQVYLDNVNPLLKVTHIPSLQGRIIDAAASNMASIKPTLAALMFGIYCVSIVSLRDDACRDMFGSPKELLLARYQHGCQQTLWNCKFLRSNDRECLTALYLYLLSAKPGVDAQSLSSLGGLAIRIAQRMGLHSESAHAKCSAFEAEMRRRLWWSLVLFDTRICETAICKAVMLTPTWDCRTPLNINDFDLRPEMKELPTIQGLSTEALFAVVRSEIGDFIRNSACYLDFVIPALKAIARDVQHGPMPEDGEISTLQKLIENKYIKYCNPENPLHFMTIWTARGQIAKYRLFESFARVASSSTQQQTDAQRNTSLSHALRMIDCDTKVMSSPLTKGYLWLNQLYFPFLAYIYICQDLRKRRPVVDHLTTQMWESMSDNYEARLAMLGVEGNPFIKIFAKVVLQAWEAQEAVALKSSSSSHNASQVPPRIVSGIRQKQARIAPKMALDSAAAAATASAAKLPPNSLDLNDTQPPISPLNSNHHTHNHNHNQGMSLNPTSSGLTTEMSGLDMNMNTNMGTDMNMEIDIDNVNPLDFLDFDWNMGMGMGGNGDWNLNSNPSANGSGGGMDYNPLSYNGNPI